MATSYPQNSRWPAIALAIVLVSSFVLKLRHLDHAAIHGLDESFHAVVARNLLKHPLMPTLVDQPYLDVPAGAWQMAHVWLHKPVLPMWQIMISFALLGVNAFALRLPSAILSTGAVALTYLIGRELVDRTAAIVAATLQAFMPAIFMLVHGYTFSDHIDITLLWWVEVGIYFIVLAMRTRRTRYIVLAGVAQGLAFLCKTYPALIILVFAGAAFFLKRLQRRDLLVFAAAAVATASPWMVYCAVQYPQEFRIENALILRHLNENVEGWAGPWDRLVFDYALRIFLRLYPMVLFAMIALAPRAWREKNIGLMLIYAWALGVFIPHTLAITKTPSATLIGWPAMWLLVGAMISRAIAGDLFLLVGWVTIAILAVFFAGPIAEKGMGYPEPRVFAGVMRGAMWVVWHVLAAVVVGAMGARMPLSRKRLGVTLIALAASLTIVPVGFMIRQAWRVTQVNRRSPNFLAIGRFVDENLPGNTVLLVDEREKLDYLNAMFYADRTCYPLRGHDWRELSRQVAAHGGLPYLVTDKPLGLPRLFFDPAEGRFVYGLTQ